MPPQRGSAGRKPRRVQGSGSGSTLHLSRDAYLFEVPDTIL